MKKAELCSMCSFDLQVYKAIDELAKKYGLVVNGSVIPRFKRQLQDQIYSSNHRGKILISSRKSMKQRKQAKMNPICLLSLSVTPT